MATNSWNSLKKVTTLKLSILCWIILGIYLVLVALPGAILHIQNKFDIILLSAHKSNASSIIVKIYLSISPIISGITEILHTISNILALYNNKFYYISSSKSMALTLGLFIACGFLCIARGMWITFQQIHDCLERCITSKTWEYFLLLIIVALPNIFPAVNLIIPGILLVSAIVFDIYNWNKIRVSAHKSK